MSVASAVTKTWAAMQWLLNAAMTANPIGLVVVGIAALTAGVIIAYKKSETFRNGVNAAWAALKKFIGFTPLGALISNFDSLKAAADRVIGALQSAWAWIDKVAGKAGGLKGVLD